VVRLVVAAVAAAVVVATACLEREPVALPPEGVFSQGRKSSHAMGFLDSLSRPSGLVAALPGTRSPAQPCAGCYSLLE
jgi:hypothetical protein